MTDDKLLTNEQPLKEMMRETDQAVAKAHDDEGGRKTPEPLTGIAQQLKGEVPAAQ